MSDKLKVDYTNLEDKANKLEKCVDVFCAGAENPFSEEVKALGEMNSDYTNILEKMIVNLDDDHCEYKTFANELSELTSKVVSTFIEVDDDMASKMGE